MGARSVTELGRVAARLASPFADREAVLRAEGLDEVGWRQEKERLERAFAETAPDDRKALATSFREGFAGPAPAPRTQAAAVEALTPAPVVAPAPPVPDAAAPNLSAAAKFVPSYLRADAMKPAEPPASRPQPSQPIVIQPQAVDETVGVGELRALSPLIMPFVAEASTKAPPRMTITAGAKAQSGFTVAARSSQRRSIPFRNGAASAAGPPPAGWDLERYGRLCIDLVRSGLEANVVLGRANITLDQRRALDRYWEERMFAEPELRLTWKQACDRRCEELDRERGAR